ncbi:MAG: Zn-dependent alcohol dehydrogenase [Actinomycetia bacterium]|nr:Zn-dependent alcohol dehydrogenase [Actinomycetes bacterium]MCP5032676.1 Zn-dependent alcohol dehydrogenase [Actinomycetes bacterium]
MRAAVLNEQPGELIIEDLSIDRPGPGEVLIQVVGAGLCHSDLHFIEGVFRTRLPIVLGHESAGIVQAVGDGVDYVKAGDHVVACLSIFCGQCPQCLSGHPNRCTNPKATSRGRGEPPRLSRADGTPVDQMARLGGFAEEMLVHQNGLVKVIEDMPLDKACLIGCGITTGFGAAVRTAKVEVGSTVCVIGAGGIGLAAIQGARIAGANKVIVVDISPSKLETAGQVGGTHFINASECEDVVAEVKDLTRGGVDYSFEAIGRADTVRQAFDMLAIGGTATIIGMVPSKDIVQLRGIDFLSEKKLQGSMMGSNQFRTDIPRMIDMYLDGRLLLDEMVTATIGLDEVNDGYQMMKNSEGARTVITF